MSETLGNIALSLAYRCVTHRAELTDFLKHFADIQLTDLASHLGSAEVVALLGRLDPVGLQILSELLDEVRIQGETKGLYSEAAYWDLIGDRVKDALLLKGSWRASS